MAFGLKFSGGDPVPYIKYDARGGRMFRVDRVRMNDGSFDNQDTDITAQCIFIADLANVQVGWISYGAQGPVKQMVTLGRAAVPPMPQDVDKEGKPLFKQGAVLRVLLPDGQGGGVREFGSTASCVLQALDALHDAYLAAPESKQGALPVVRLARVTMVKAGQSTNYAPVFEIVQWVARPAALAVAGAPAAPAPPPAQPVPNGFGAPPAGAIGGYAPAPQTPPPHAQWAGTTPAATGSTPVAPPPAAPAAPQVDPNAWG